MKTFMALMTLLVLAAPVYAFAGIDGDLIKAAKKGDLAQVKELLDKGADPDAWSFWSGSPLQRAAYNGHFEVVKLLFERGADPKSHGGINSLFGAAARNMPDMARYVIEQGVDVNAKGTGGITPLIVASRKGNVEVAKALLENGAATDMADDSGRTPLSFARKKGHMQIVQLLKNSSQKETKGSVQASGSSGSGASGEPREIDSVFLNVVKIGEIEMVRKLLAKGANPGMDFGAPIRIASRRGDKEIVKLLLDAGAYVDDRKSSRSFTALHEASDNGHADIAKLLLKNGADINLSTNVNYMTFNGKIVNPIKIASESCALSVVKVLIGNGADLKGASGYTREKQKSLSKEIGFSGMTGTPVKELEKQISDCKKIEELIALAEAKQLLNE